MNEECIWLKRAVRELSRSVWLTKRLGQHIMVDCRIGYEFARTVMELNPQVVFEFGAGAGLLTRFVARAASHVVAVEIDARLTDILHMNTRDLVNVYPIMSDGLSLIERGVVRADVLVSNTPYILSSSLLISFIKSKMRAAVLMLQKEVADRLLSDPGNRSYGRLTAIVQTFAKVRKIADFPPSSFFPEPEVSSSLVAIERTREWREEWKNYEDLVRCLFNQKRKLAYKVLKSCVETLGDVNKVIPEWTRKKRVIELSVDDLLELYMTVFRGARDYS